ncbi:MAG TPA: STAS domain-containing protein [Phototrophicaceae bacterium]|nr:STAS domain-containing protein [Phototrophicaceae bacterium]
MVDIAVSEHNQVTLMEVSGRVDSMNANQLGTALSDEIDSGKLRIVLDLAQVDFMSSAGLRELVNALKKVKKATGDMRLAQPSARVREVLEMAGLDTIFLIFDSQQEAVSSY